jgi:spore coat polysaccharide biosynthesis predicted glycosyltransferase SpsG
LKLVIFSEAGFQYGFGHFYRMSGICERAQREGLDVTMYLMADDAARANLNRDFVEFADWKEPAFYEEKLTENTLLVIDSYHVDLDLLETFNELAGDMIVIDDNIRLDYHDMKILNPNYFGIWLEYPEDRNNTMYLGKDYTLVRDEFTMHGPRIFREEVTDVLVTMGGTDPAGRTAGIVDMLREASSSVRLHVVCTAAYRDLDDIRSRLGENDILHINIGAEEMCSLMENCDFAVASAGGTTNELVRMQCPAVLVVVADNQVLNTRYLSDAGYTVSMFEDDSSIIREMFSCEKRKALADKLKSFSSDRSGKDLICDLARSGGTDGR